MHTAALDDRVPDFRFPFFINLFSFEKNAVSSLVCDKCNTSRVMTTL